MDLGIKGRRALVCASSKGLGRGCAEALAAEGVHLTLNARGSEALEATAAAIRAAHGVDVMAVPADITSEEGQAAVLAAAGEVAAVVPVVPTRVRQKGRQNNLVLRALRAKRRPALLRGLLVLLLDALFLSAIAAKSRLRALVLVAAMAKITITMAVSALAKRYGI